MITFRLSIFIFFIKTIKINKFKIIFNLITLVFNIFNNFINDNDLNNCYSAEPIYAYSNNQELVKFYNDSNIIRMAYGFLNKVLKRSFGCVMNLNQQITISLSVTEKKADTSILYKDIKQIISTS